MPSSEVLGVSRMRTSLGRKEEAGTLGYLEGAWSGIRHPGSWRKVGWTPGCFSAGMGSRVPEGGVNLFQGH